MQSSKIKTAAEHTQFKHKKIIIIIFFLIYKKIKSNLKYTL